MATPTDTICQFLWRVNSSKLALSDARTIEKLGAMRLRIFDFHGKKLWKFHTCHDCSRLFIRYRHKCGSIMLTTWISPLSLPYFGFHGPFYGMNKRSTFRNHQATNKHTVNEDFLCRYRMPQQDSIFGQY